MSLRQSCIAALALCACSERPLPESSASAGSASTGTGAPTTGTPTTGAPPEIAPLHADADAALDLVIAAGDDGLWLIPAAPWRVTRSPRRAAPGRCAR